MPRPHEDAAPYPDTQLHALRLVLHDLAHNHSPTLANPPDVTKRASVALILRVKPHYTHWPPPAPPSSQSRAADPTAPSADGTSTATAISAAIDAHFAQDWVRHGDPEILFIKRASRRGDRWTGHVALPGGRRDPGDADDAAAAVRETAEEVGIALAPGSAIPVGNLPQRLVTTSWGTVPYAASPPLPPHRTLARPLTSFSPAPR